ncbi:MAG: dihydroorotate dehydrogenase-like protein [Bacteroidales bacterium]|nr:MAG: dihydroorotate dehydrogenase-like protein [Bacteroidales bacterium]
MDFTTTYMGLGLRTPIIAGSSGLTKSIGLIKRMADSGAGAVILKSLFEEQLVQDPKALSEQDEMYFRYPEVFEYLDKFPVEDGVEAYLNLIQEAKEAVNIPVIASINCISATEWTSFAREITKAGADGLELNIAIYPFNKNVDSQTIEDTYIKILKGVKENTGIPVSVKIGNNFTNIYRITNRLDEAGADALVLFNRFSRPDIDIQTLKPVSGSTMSSPQEITESLKWISILSPELKCSLAGATGIHNAGGIIKQLLAGADAVQVTSTLYQHGIEYIGKMIDDLVAWMKKFGYSSIGDFKNLMVRNEDAAALERVEFMKKTVGEVE